jgi:hypothetical protein
VRITIDPQQLIRLILYPHIGQGQLKSNTVGSPLKSWRPAPFELVFEEDAMTADPGRSLHRLMQYENMGRI